MSRDPDDFSTIAKSNNLGYKPLELNSQEVYDRARMYYTAAEIAKRFKVDENTILQKYGDAFHRGKEEACNKPRVLMNKVLSDFMRDPDVNLARADANTGILLKALETKAKIYDRMGQQDVQVTVTQNPLSKLSDEELRAALEAAGYVKKAE